MESDQWAKEYKESKMSIIFKWSIYICVLFIEMPFGRVPDLAVDGTLISGSLNILRYLGMKFGKNPLRCIIFAHLIIVLRTKLALIQFREQRKEN